MKRLTVAVALICALFGPILAFADEPPKRSAVVAAAEIATCMTENLYQPGEDGIIVSGSVLSASLAEEYDVFARVEQSGVPVLYMTPGQNVSRYNQQRAILARDCALGVGVEVAS